MIPDDSDDVTLLSLRRMALNQVCFYLASPDRAITTALFSTFSAGGGGAPLQSSPGVEVGIPSSIGDAVLKRARETGCLTDQAVLELLRWCTPLSLCLARASLAITDSLLIRYPPEACAHLEEVRLGWSPHLREVEAFLLKIRKAGAAGQEDEEGALRVLDVSGKEDLSDGILKALAARCPALCSLTVDKCVNLNGSFLERLARGCPALSTFSADTCVGLTDSVLSNFLMESQAVTLGVLRSLRFGRCPVGALTVQTLMMRGGCLRELNLDGCSGLGDASVRMICRACPGLLQLSLLGCSTLTCRGAWQCTQHPTLETLSIPFPLSPIPDLIPAEEKRVHGRGRGGRQHPQGASGTAKNNNTAATECGISGLHDEGREGEALPLEMGAAQAAMTSGISIAEASTALAPPPPPPPPPNVLSPTPSSPESSPSSSSVSPGGGGGGDGSRRRRVGDGISPSRKKRTGTRSSSPMPSPLPLPRVPTAGPLRHLRLEVTFVDATVQAGAAPAARRTAAAGNANDGDEEGGGGEEQSAAGLDVGSNATASSTRGTAGFGVAVSVELPLRRLAPLLPPTLKELDVRSCDAPPLLLQASMNGGEHCPTTWHATRYEAQESERAGGSGDTGWEEHRTADSGGGGVRACHAMIDVSVAAGDLLVLVQACPLLEGLVLCGNPDQRVARAPLAARIRGRGAEALRTTASAGVHATAAAVAYCLRSCTANDGNRGDGGDGADRCHGTTGSGGDRPPSSSLRSLTLIDCPSLPPLAILEALAVENGAALQHVSLGISSPPPSGSGAGHDLNMQPKRRPLDVGGAGGRERIRGGLSDEDVGMEGDGVVRLVSETLETLSVSGEGRLRELGVVRCPRLKRMDVSRCPGLRSLEVECAPVLKEVRAKECCLQNTEVVALAAACWRLEVLHVSGNDAIGDEVLVSALRGCPRLRSLRMDSCRAVGSSGSLLAFLRPQHLLSVGSTYLRLSELTVSHAPKFTGGHLVALAAALPCLRRLTVAHCRGFVEVVEAFLEDGGQGTGEVGFDEVVNEVKGEGEMGGGVVEGESGIYGGTIDGRVSGGVSTARHCGMREGEYKEKDDKDEGGDESEHYGCDYAVPDYKRTATTLSTGTECTIDVADGFVRMGQQRGDTIHDNENNINSDNVNEENDGDEEHVSSISIAGSNNYRGSERDKCGVGNIEAGAVDDGDEETLGHLIGKKNTKRGKKTITKDTRRRRRKAGETSAAVVDSSEHDGVLPATDDFSDGDNTQGTRDGRGSSGHGGRGSGKPGRGAKAKGSSGKFKESSKGGGGGGVGGSAAAASARSTAAECRKAGNKGEGAGRDRGARGDGGRAGDTDDGEEGDVCQGLEFTVDGKTRAKLEKLAASLPREPGKKRHGRPSCIRFLQDACPNSARDCSWAHLPMHPPKTLRFKPLITQAHEPKTLAKWAPHSYRTPVGTSSAASASTGTPSTAPVGDGGGQCRRGDRVNASGGGAGDVGEGGAADREGAFFPNLQFLNIDSCTGLKSLNGLRCPALAVVRVTSCRELKSLMIDAPVASQLDLTGCVRLEPWDLSFSATAGGGGGLSGLQVAVLNYCRALSAKFLALLVNHARHLHRLEIYGAAAVMGPHGPAGGSMGKKEMGGGKRDSSRVDYNRINIKTTAILKSLEKGRPKLTVIRTKRDFSRDHDGTS